MKAVLLAAESSANCVETFRSLQVVGVLAVGVSEGGDDGVAGLVACGRRPMCTIGGCNGVRVIGCGDAIISDDDVGCPLVV